MLVSVGCREDGAEGLRHNYGVGGSLDGWPELRAARRLRSGTYILSTKNARSKLPLKPG